MIVVIYKDTFICIVQNVIIIMHAYFFTTGIIISQGFQVIKGGKRTLSLEKKDINGTNREKKGQNFLRFISIKNHR